MELFFKSEQSGKRKKQDNKTSTLGNWGQQTWHSSVGAGVEKQSDLQNAK